VRDGTLARRSAGVSAGSRRYAIDFASRAEAVPAGIVAPDWQRVFSRLEAFSVAGTELIHHDLHLGNALFEGGALSGIVDWTEARTGPWQFDVGYCRADLSLLFGLEAADELLFAYEFERGERVPQRALWDLAGALEAFPDPEKWRRAWLELGRHDLSADLVRERLTAFVERALSET
jgi:aminoglycoside phosphotransferase (APT) family kinase protein